MQSILDSLYNNTTKTDSFLTETYKTQDGLTEFLVTQIQLENEGGLCEFLRFLLSDCKIIENKTVFSNKLYKEVENSTLPKKESLLVILKPYTSAINV